MLPILYNNVKTIVQTDTHVMILTEWMHDARIIPLDDEHAPQDVRSLSGDSIGRWEGEDTMIRVRGRAHVHADGSVAAEPREFEKVGAPD